MSTEISNFRLPKRGRKQSNRIIKMLISPPRNFLIALRMFWLRKILRMDIHPSSRVSLKARLDFTNPHGIHIDEGSYVAFGATILSHDMARVTHFDTYIGKNCFIGANSIVLPGVMIGDQCIVAAGCVVTKDVPSHSLVVGNPGKIIKTDIRTKKWGILVESFDSHALLPDG